LAAFQVTFIGRFWVIPEAERDPRFIKYLLGELPEPERTKLEDEYLGDDETFERPVAAEEELIYTYVRGGLFARAAFWFRSAISANPGAAVARGVCHYVHSVFGGHCGALGTLT